MEVFMTHGSQRGFKAIQDIKLEYDKINIHCINNEKKEEKYYDASEDL
jgi:hypothetical protein